MKKNSSIILLLAAITFQSTFASCNAQTNADGNGGMGKIENTPDGIKWMSFEEAVAQSEKNPKKIFIDVYTSWCGWCKKMDATTFQETEVINFINEHYYPVKLNAETKDTIRFQGKEFVYVPEYKSNQLAVSLLSGKMGYPSYVLLDENFALMTAPIQSYLEKKDLMPVLNYYGNNIYKEKSWEEYQGKK